jgi:hypothetical protein
MGTQRGGARAASSSLRQTPSRAEFLRRVSVRIEAQLTRINDGRPCGYVDLLPRAGLYDLDIGEMGIEIAQRQQYHTWRGPTVRARHHR